MAQVSKRGRTKRDAEGRHGAFASSGWNYRTAYFQDFDGKYYKMRIAVAQGKDGNVVYNIGQIQERSFPGIDGSSARGGAPKNGETSSISIISDPDGKSNGKFSISSRDMIPEQIKSATENTGALYAQTGWISDGIQPVSVDIRRLCNPDSPGNYEIFIFLTCDFDATLLSSFSTDEICLRHSAQILRSFPDKPKAHGSRRALLVDCIVIRH